MDTGYLTQLLIGDSMKLKILNYCTSTVWVKPQQHVYRITQSHHTLYRAPWTLENLVNAPAPPEPVDRHLPLCFWSPVYMLFMAQNVGSLHRGKMARTGFVVTCLAISLDYQSIWEVRFKCLVHPGSNLCLWGLPFKPSRDYLLMYVLDYYYYLQSEAPCIWVAGQSEVKTNSTKENGAIFYTIM